MGSGYQVEPSRATPNDPPYRDLPGPPALAKTLRIHQGDGRLSLHVVMKYLIPAARRIPPAIPNASIFREGLARGPFKDS